MRRLRDTGFRLSDFTVAGRSGLETGVATPRVVVRSLARHGERLLLCRRAELPQRGKWSLPGGYVEPGESLATAVVRETAEETCCTVKVSGLLGIYDMPQAQEVVFVFGAELRSRTIRCGPEALEARLFTMESLPWDQLAFPTDWDALRRNRGLGRGLPVPTLAELVWGEDERIRIRER
jgi:ADP-ribose pyrophosphatase YjhB (NUDIX family)